MTDDLDEFSTPLGTGMVRVPAPLRDRHADDALRARLAEFDAVRERGAAEARLTPLYREVTP